MIIIWEKKRDEKKELIDKIETCGIWFLAGMAAMFCIMAAFIKG